MDEKTFNAIAYNYRSWPGHDPKGVSERYEELWVVFKEQEEIIKELRMKLINALFEIEYAKRSDEWVNAK